MSKITSYMMLEKESNKKALFTMQDELSRLSDMWNGQDGSDDIDRDEAYQKHSEELLKQEPF